MQLQNSIDVPMMMMTGAIVYSGRVGCTVRRGAGQRGPRRGRVRRVAARDAAGRAPARRSCC